MLALHQLRRFRKGTIGVLGIAGVNDQPIAAVHQVFDEQAAPGDLAQPPQKGGQPGHQQGEDHAWHMQRGVASGLDDDLFAVPRRGACALRVQRDRRLDLRCLGIWLGHQNDGARRELHGQLLHGSQRKLRPCAVRCVRGQ